MQIKLLSIIIIMLFITACQPERAAVSIGPTSTVTAVPTTGPAPVISPTATMTIAPSATPIPDPSVTATFTPTPTITPTPTNTPIPEAPVNAITLEPFIQSGLLKPLYLTHAGDGRLFIVEQPGRIRIWQEGTLLAEPFLDIQDRVNDFSNEQGLLSVAFHPDYDQNGRFFVNYNNGSGDTVIARYEVSADDPNRADRDSEVILLVIDQPFENHNGGLLKFGPDGYLYVGMGDGGSQRDPLGHGQNRATLLGAILRLDVDYEDGSSFYGVPFDNPFVNDPNARNEIWAYGLRNPWRFTFDRLTDDLYIGDVGQNIWEEVHFTPAGGGGGENYGWPILEGSNCLDGRGCDPTGLEQPIFEYDHSLGCSVTAGYVYRGNAHLELYGNYFLSDFCTGYIWRLFQNQDGIWESANLAHLGLPVASFGEDVHGELYVVALSGQVFRLTP